ncbi:hypothetical protein DFJ73DRAFT_763195 [Zopfochytrium polystomum]|nr:hypothetical protein DFJ73DRAFT_763195 [Zopfochytrium polystomum]
MDLAVAATVPAAAGPDAAAAGDGWDAAVAAAAAASEEAVAGNERPAVPHAARLLLPRSSSSSSNSRRRRSSTTTTSSNSGRLEKDSGEDGVDVGVEIHSDSSSSSSSSSSTRSTTTTVACGDASATASRKNSHLSNSADSPPSSGEDCDHSRPDPSAKQSPSSMVHGGPLKHGAVSVSFTSLSSTPSPTGVPLFPHIASPQYPRSMQSPSSLSANSPPFIPSANVVAGVKGNGFSNTSMSPLASSPLQSSPAGTNRNATGSPARQTLQLQIVNFSADPSSLARTEEENVQERYAWPSSPISRSVSAAASMGSGLSTIRSSASTGSFASAQGSFVSYSSSPSSPTSLASFASTWSSSRRNSTAAHSLRTAASSENTSTTVSINDSEKNAVRSLPRLHRTPGYVALDQRAAAAGDIHSLTFPPNVQMAETAQSGNSVVVPTGATVTSPPSTPSMKGHQSYVRHRRMHGQKSQDQSMGPAETHRPPSPTSPPTQDGPRRQASVQSHLQVAPQAAGEPVPPFPLNSSSSNPQLRGWTRLRNSSSFPSPAASQTSAPEQPPVPALPLAYQSAHTAPGQNPSQLYQTTSSPHLGVRKVSQTLLSFEPLASPSSPLRMLTPRTPPVVMQRPDLLSDDPMERLPPTLLAGIEGLFDEDFAPPSGAGGFRAAPAELDPWESLVMSAETDRALPYSSLTSLASGGGGSAAVASPPSTSPRGVGAATLTTGFRRPSLLPLHIQQQQQQQQQQAGASYHYPESSSLGRRLSRPLQGASGTGTPVEELAATVAWHGWGDSQGQGAGSGGSGGDWRRW